MNQQIHTEDILEAMIHLMYGEYKFPVKDFSLSASEFHRIEEYMKQFDIECHMNYPELWDIQQRYPGLLTINEHCVTIDHNYVADHGKKDQDAAIILRWNFDAKLNSYITEYFNNNKYSNSFDMGEMPSIPDYIEIGQDWVREMKRYLENNTTLLSIIPIQKVNLFIIRVRNIKRDLERMIYRHDRVYEDKNLEINELEDEIADLKRTCFDNTIYRSNFDEASKEFKAYWEKMKELPEKRRQAYIDAENAHTARQVYDLRLNYINNHLLPYLEKEKQKREQEKKD